MADRDISPVPDRPGPEGQGHYTADDDIELPPMSDASSSSGDEPGWPRANAVTRSGNAVKILGTAALVGALLVGGWFATRGGSAEKQHPNWQHVEAAADASTPADGRLLHIDGAGRAETVASIEVVTADADRATLGDIRTALRRNDLSAATASLQAAQQMAGGPQNKAELPELTTSSQLTRSLQEGGELYRIQLFDACAEDGDVVEVLVNGALFATVPITHEGSVLSIPLARGNNSVAIRGVVDGGGGVTVAFRTSRGEYFARPMGVGEEHRIAVVVQ